MEEAPLRAVLEASALDRAFATARDHAPQALVPFTILSVANAAGTIRTDGTAEPGRSAT